MIHEGFLIAAVVLFILDALLYWGPSSTWTGRLTPAGLAFFAASFLV